MSARSEVPARVRKCTASDVSEIYRLVRALAVYEKEPESVSTTEADLRRDGFELPNPLFHAALAEVLVEGSEKWKPVGLAMYYTSYSSWRGKCLYLEDLFVESDYRGCGLGGKLLTHTVETALEMGCARLEWVVLDWNTPSIAYYKSVGARNLDEWKLMRLDRAGLELFVAKNRERCS